MKWQALLLTLIILTSFALTQVRQPKETILAEEKGTHTAQIPESAPENLSHQRATLVPEVNVKKSPSRNWNVLEPEVKAKSVLIQSLDEHFPFFHYNTYQPWPLASLTKLLTAVVVLEEIGADKKIEIRDTAIATEGEAGDLRSGEVYAARDLVKIMLLTSSNDAAAAFEDHVGGKNELVRLLNQKAQKLGMSQTILHDASGLSDVNVGTATDLLRLVKYSAENHTEIFGWTRLPSVLIQPANDTETKTIYNINKLALRNDFLGGKTGTADTARENLAAILSFENQRIAIIILGSLNRLREIDDLLLWIKKAYEF